MPITARQLRSFVNEVREVKAIESAPPPPEAPGTLHFGPLEQALMVLIIVGWVSDQSSTGIPSLLSPGITLLLLLAYVGYKLLERQREAEKKAKRATPPVSKPYKSPSSSAPSAHPNTEMKPSGSGIITKADLLKDKSRLREKSSSTSRDVRAATSKTQYFLTMQGPGRPALVPFPRGFNAHANSPDGTLWWNNSRNLDLKDVMVQPSAPAKSSRDERKEKEASRHVQAPGTISAEEIRARIPLEREMERYEKAIMVLQCILALLLCFVDQKLGFGLLAMFLFFHFRSEKEKEAARARNVAALPPGENNPYDDEGTAEMPTSRSTSSK